MTTDPADPANGTATPGDAPARQEEAASDAESPDADAHQDPVKGIGAATPGDAASDARVTPSDASVTPSDANGDAKEGPKSQTPCGFAPLVTPSDAKNPHLSVATTGKREEERTGESAEREKKKNGKTASLGVTGVTNDGAPTPGDAEPPDADAHQDPVGDEIGPCTRCGRPADRYTATGKAICSECVEGGKQSDALARGDAAHPAFLSWRDEIRALAEAYRAGKAKLQSTRQDDKDDEDDLF